MRRSGLSPTPRFKTVGISMRVEDVDALDTRVEAIRQRGWAGANRSRLVRIALEQLDLDKIEIDELED